MLDTIVMYQAADELLHAPRIEAQEDQLQWKITSKVSITVVNGPIVWSHGADFLAELVVMLPGNELMETTPETLGDYVRAKILARISELGTLRYKRHLLLRAMSEPEVEALFSKPSSPGAYQPTS